MNLSLLYPLCAMAGLTFLVGLFLFLSRVAAVRTGRTKLRYFETFSVGAPTDTALKASQHFTNLFEVPTLFYVACLTAMVIPVHSPWIVRWAWLFFFARCLHAFVHIGPNKLPPRIATFFLGVFAVMFMWIEIFLAAS